MRAIYLLIVITHILSMITMILELQGMSSSSVEFGMSSYFYNCMKRKIFQYFMCFFYVLQDQSYLTWNLLDNCNFQQVKWQESSPFHVNKENLSSIVIRTITEGLDRGEGDPNETGVEGRRER